MINMKLSKKEAQAEVAPSPGDGPAYPYGLSLCLDTETLEKLGYSEPPAVGSKLTVTALVTVTSTGVNQQQDGDKRQHCDLQITDMELGAADIDRAQRAYPNMNP